MPTPNPTPPAPGAAAAVTTTALCAAHRCNVCPGRIVSLTPAHGQPCACPCHTPSDPARKAAA
jgi:hypothetical protein